MNEIIYFIHDNGLIIDHDEIIKILLNNDFEYELGYGMVNQILVRCLHIRFKLHKKT